MPSGCLKIKKKTAWYLREGILFFNNLIFLKTNWKHRESVSNEHYYSPLQLTGNLYREVSQYKLGGTVVNRILMVKDNIYEWNKRSVSSRRYKGE